MESDSLPTTAACDRCGSIAGVVVFRECRICGPVPLCPSCAATHRQENLIAALGDLYDERGVHIWLTAWRAADENKRASMEQSVHAMTDGAYL